MFGSLMKEIASTCAMKREHPKFPGNRNGFTEPHHAMSNGKINGFVPEEFFELTKPANQKPDRKLNASLLSYNAIQEDHSSQQEPVAGNDFCDNAGKTLENDRSHPDHRRSDSYVLK